MNKLLLVLALSIGFVGCAAHEKVESPKAEHVITYGVDLKDHPDARTDFTLESEGEYEVVEKYGSIAFKAISVCYSKYDYMLAKLDLSSDYGATVLQEYQVNTYKCVQETLKPYPVIPEADRIKIPRDNVGLELKEEEEGGFDQIDQDRFQSVLPAVAGNDKSYRDDPAFQAQLPACTANNMSIEDDEEFVEAVDFCALKGM